MNRRGRLKDEVINIIATANFAARRHELVKRLAALHEAVADVRAFNSLGPSLAESHEVYRDLTAAEGSVRAALERVKGGINSQSFKGKITAWGLRRSSCARAMKL